MTLRKRIVWLALAASLSLSTAMASGNPQNEIARYLAGLVPSPQSGIQPLTQEPAWVTHAEQMNAAWARLESTQLEPVRVWSASHLQPPHPTLLYMFGGPDYLYARNFFPDARTYVLAGLEPPGRVLNLSRLSAEDRQLGLERLRESLKTVFDTSFFVTADMLKDLQGHAFSGVLPLLYLFLARSGMEITEVRHVGLKEDGETFVMPGPARVRPNGLEVLFKDPQRQAERRLIYFSIDLSDAALGDGAFLKFLERLGPADAFFKSASYLPQAENFSRIRNAVLTQSGRILQDDTGPLLSAFDRATWKLTPFGTYTRPIQMFDWTFQPALAQLFQRGSPGPVTFRLGYGYGIDTTGVVLATRR